MAHFAQLDENNVVLTVAVVANDNITDENGQEQEHLGVAFMQGLLGPDTRWVQASYNANFRGKYPCIGDRYDETADVFVNAFDPNSPPPAPALARARDDQGRFVADDPSTLNVDEAWVAAA